MSTVEYTAEVRHDNRLHVITVPGLRIPICQACGEKVFTEEVDQQVDDALRAHLGVLTPAKIRRALDRIQLSQKEVAERLGIAEATLSRWLTETQIQTKSMDRFLRVFFAFPEVRQALSTEWLDPGFGTEDIAGSPAGATCGGPRQYRSNLNTPWRTAPRRMSETCARAQQEVLRAGTTWGVRKGR